MSFNPRSYTFGDEVKTTKEVQDEVTDMREDVDDINEKIESTSITPTLSSGTKIADFKIGEESGELYAPEGGSGGSAVLTADLTAAIDVGGIEEGTTFTQGTSLETVLSSMLSPTLYPTLTAPSASMTISPTTKLFETGSSHDVTFALTLNRGSISPAYGTSGYRSGAATSYTLDGVTQENNTFSKTITAAGSYIGTVAYAEGEQPKDSKGGDYNTALAAGSVNTGSIAFEFVDALWANTSDISTVAKQSLVSKSTKVKQFNFPAQTVANPEIFDVPSAWTVTAVEVLNTLSNQWEDCSSEFTTSETTHEDAGGNTVNYIRYTDNRGYAAGARSVRVKWS